MDLNELDVREWAKEHPQEEEGLNAGPQDPVAPREPVFGGRKGPKPDSDSENTQVWQVVGFLALLILLIGLTAFAIDYMKHKSETNPSATPTVTVKPLTVTEFVRNYMTVKTYDNGTQAIVTCRKTCSINPDTGEEDCKVPNC